MDNGKTPDIQSLVERDFGDGISSDPRSEHIRKAGLKAGSFQIDKASEHALEELRKAIIKNGSSITSITGRGINAIVDEVSEDLSCVRLRDPFHGWEITVTSRAFLKAWDGTDFVFVSDHANK